MDIGEEKPAIIVEPVRDPFERDPAPEPDPEPPPAREPVEEPSVGQRDRLVQAPADHVVAVASGQVLESLCDPRFDVAGGVPLGADADPAVVAFGELNPLERAIVVDALQVDRLRREEHGGDPTPSPGAFERLRRGAPAAAAPAMREPRTIDIHQLQAPLEQLGERLNAAISQIDHIERRRRHGTPHAHRHPR